MIAQTDKFREVLEGLNPAQRHAVDTIHGPMMVLAGPGTGKTHMLAARIGNILALDQVEPRNILCLTFTNAGVKAMRDRLVSFIGAAGSRVAVHTFHDFAREVIEEFPGRFESISWEPMDDLDRHRIINEMIDGLPPKHDMRGPGHEPYARAKDLMWLFDKMAQESWSAEEVVAEANHHVLDLPNIPEYVYQRKYKDKQPGDLKPKAAEEEEKMRLLAEAAKLRERYSALKHDRSLYDYADQLAWLSDALEQDETLRMQLRERYQYVLVDEFQDTNDLQSKIVTLLAEEEHPNLFVVGDDDQSIYGFQGVRIANLFKFSQRYPSIQALQLINNYRSHSAILEAAKYVIEQNESRLPAIGPHPVEKDLVESSTRWQAPPKTLFEDDATRPLPEVRRYPTELAQAHYTARQLQDWIAEGIDPNDIGVIYRTHAQAARLLECCERLSVPYRLERSINVLQEPLILRLRACLGFIAGLRSDRQTVEQHAMEFMLCPAVGLTATELDNVNSFRFTHSRRVPGWRYLLQHPEALEGDDIPINNPDRFRHAAALINELAALVDRYPLGTLVQQVAQQTGLLREALDGDERRLALECIDALVRDANVRVRKDPGLSLEGLCRTWDEMDAFDLAIRLVKQADTRPAVSFMTAHSAKGLEFECVVMYDVNTAKWESRRRYNEPFRLPPGLLVAITDSDPKEEENRRLLYVALTRAKQRLVMTVAEESQTGKGQSLATDVDLLIQEQLANDTKPEVDDEELYDTLEKIYSAPLKPAPQPLDTAVARTKWQDRELSLGAITQFNRCKVGFYYQYVSEVPRTTRARDRYRNAVHATIQEFYGNALKPEDQQFQTEEELVALFTHHLNRERGGIKSDEMERFQAEGEATMRAWYRSEDDPFLFDVLLERSFHLTLPSGVQVKGRVDRIDIDPSSTLGIPVDYKIGDARQITTGRKTRGEDKGTFKELSDPRWRQLAYYAILLRDGLNKGALPRRGKVVNLSPKGTVVQVVELDPEAVAELEDELHATYHAILDAEDFAGCHEDEEKSDWDKGNCNWCKYHYLKRNSVELVSEEVEALDE